MARIRNRNSADFQDREALWKVGKYIRLSREDGNAVSESIVNQNNILDDEIPHFFEDGRYEVVDTYIDDGTSGTTDQEREDFQRMVQDIRAGRINCIIVKNLSRAFRNSANQGRFLEEFIPLYDTRFISLYEPRIDTFLNPEVVHSLEVGIVGFINEQCAYETSKDVRRTFRHKREKGEFIGAFAPYGYTKASEDRNRLQVDDEAAQVVREIFSWYVGLGMSKAGIVKRLNELGIPNPTAYKRLHGLRYENPHANQNDGLWSQSSVSRILQNPLYIGTMRQGRQKVISYKIHRRTSVPERDWFVVENVVPPIVEQATFRLAQALHQKDMRTAPGQGKVNLFAGLLHCAECGKGMTRRTSKGYVYYACRTYTEKSKEHCAKHTIREDRLEQAVLVSLQKQIELLSSRSDIFAEIGQAPALRSNTQRINDLLEQRRKELKKLPILQDELYKDWKSGEISQEQFHRLREKLEERAEQLQQTISNLQQEVKAQTNGADVVDAYLAFFLRWQNIGKLQRGLLVEFVRAIYIHINGEVEIEFQYADPYRRILEAAAGSQQEPLETR